MPASLAIEHAYEVVRLQARIEELERDLELERIAKQTAIDSLRQANQDNAILFERYEGLSVERMKNIMETQSKSFAIRKLETLFVYMLKGELAYRAVLWRQNSVSGVQAEQMAQELERMSKHAGIRMLKNVVAYMVKGEIGLALLVWRTARSDEVGDSLTEKAMALQEQLKMRTQSTGIKMLSHTLAYIVKGELGLRISVWRGEQQSEEASREAFEREAAMKESLLAMSHSTGFKMLKQVVAFELKGELGMRLSVWRSSLAEEVYGCGSPVCRAERQRLLSQLYALKSQARTSNVFRSAFYASSIDPQSY